MSKYKICKICNEELSFVSGQFTKHLLEYHNLSLKEYIIKVDFEGKPPRCKCGFCDEDAPFFRGKFLARINEHRKYDWLMKQYIEKFGTPKCVTCGGDVKWRRGAPNKYCSFGCIPNNWNQEKIKETVVNRYGVDNISFLTDIKDKISKSNKKLDRDEILSKSKETSQKRYNVDFYSMTPKYKERYKKSCLEKYGVDNPAKLIENRDKFSKQMILNNSLFDFKNYFKIRKYKNTNLCYQSSYEYHFLTFCENKSLLNRIDNGNVYLFLEEDRDLGFRTLTDFSLDNVEIEIKSTYILQKQGGYAVIDIKRKAVERSGKKYLLILDKDYAEFNKLIDDIC